MRLLHISDLHFSKISWKWRDLFSKRLLGTCNLLFRRKHQFQAHLLETLFPLFDDWKIDALLITGDLTSTSLQEEFDMAHEFLQKVQKKKIEIFLLPGNHDVYTKESYEKKSFYRSFEDIADLSCLEKSGVSHYALSEKWEIICLDCSRATSLFSSQGHFSEKIEQNLVDTLSSLRKKNILLATHFPFTGKISPRKMLKRKDVLQKILQSHPKVKIALHGHRHYPSFEDLRGKNLPICIGVGPVTQVHDASIHLLEIFSEKITTSFFLWEKEQWREKEKQSFSV